MYTTLEERAKSLESSASRVARELSTVVLGPEVEVAPVGQARQETVVVIGRVRTSADSSRGTITQPL